MRFVKVNEVPKKTPKYRVQAYLEEFMRMNVKVVRVENHNYKSTRVAASCLTDACKRHVLPISVHVSAGEVYLVRRDI